MEKKKVKVGPKLSDFRKDSVQAVRFNKTLMRVMKDDYELSVQQIFDMGMKFYILKREINLDQLNLEPSVKGRKPNKPKPKKEKVL